MSSKSSTQTKYFCITINNYDEQSTISYYRSLLEMSKLSYCILGRETSTTGTRHLQGYVELPMRIRLAGARKLFPGAHIEVRGGTAQQARDYCRKDGDYEEFGTISDCSKKGKRTDLDELHQFLRDGGSLINVSNEYFGPFLRYQRSIKEYIFINSEKRSWQVDVHVYWGKTRTGKTRKAYEEATNEVWVYPGKGWFDGYYGQAHVLFDDFYGDMPISLLLKVLDDWYPCSVPTKGGHVNWAPKKIWITSNTDPRDWYSSESIPSDVRDALLARLKTIVHFANFP